ncbi:MAG: phosphatase PAP2 family protein [Saprospiraceae bacterium]|nr:phosphatase PAP2 family protein [Saprospiraceae bacterium]
MKILKHIPLLVLAFLAGTVFFTACQKDNLEQSELTVAFSADVPHKWYKLFEEIDRYAPGYRPPAAARALGYIGLAGYEAAVHGMPDHRSLVYQFGGLSLPQAEKGSAYHWPTAVNAAYYTMLKHFYPHVQASHLAAMEQLNTNFSNEFAGAASPEVLDRSAAFGTAVANAIFEWSKTDATGHEAYLNPRPSSYIPPAGPGLWQPSWPDFSPALFPYWGQVRPFAMRPDDLNARAPLPWSETPNAQIYNQAREVQIWVDKIKVGQDSEAHWIAEFWSDDFGGVTFTPAGRWIAIANQVVALEKPSLETAVELYAKMGMSLSDAGVAVWNSKFKYNYERPIHYIRRNFDPGWQTIMNNPVTGVTGITPEFPAYPSGHSGFGGAAATVLTEIFGYQYPFTDYCHQNRSEFKGTPRTFNTFIDMAVENAYSRIPLGVHFRMDCDEGLRLGYLAGQRVLDLPWRR